MTEKSSFCPLCGELNHCALHLASNATDCWCRHAPIPPTLTAQAKEKPQQCICQQCVKQANNLSMEIQ